MALHIFYEHSEIKYVGKTLPLPNFGTNMKQNIKQKFSEKLSSDAGLNKAGLFARASRLNLLAKLGRGGDFHPALWNSMYIL